MNMLEVGDRFRYISWGWVVLSVDDKYYQIQMLGVYGATPPIKRLDKWFIHEKIRQKHIIILSKKNKIQIET